MVEDTGAALAQPPKSSSSVTEGAGGLDVVGEAPQPAPTSLAVSVSGSFIIEDGLEGAGAAGSGSGVLHAFEPHGSIAAGLRLGMEVVVLTGLGGSAGLGAGLLRLNAELRSG